MPYLNNLDPENIYMSYLGSKIETGVDDIVICINYEALPLCNVQRLSEVCWAGGFPWRRTCHRFLQSNTSNRFLARTGTCLSYVNLIDGSGMLLAGLPVLRGTHLGGAGGITWISDLFIG